MLSVRERELTALADQKTGDMHHTCGKETEHLVAQFQMSLINNRNIISNL